MGIFDDIKNKAEQGADQIAVDKAASLESKLLGRVKEKAGSLLGGAAQGATHSTAGGPTGRNNVARQTPFGAYFFTVDIDGENISYPFKSCSGLKSESTVVELEEGGFNSTTRKLVGRTKYPNIVLKRGFVGAGTRLYKLRLKMMNDLPSGAAAEKGFKMPNRFSGVITQKGPNNSCAKWAFVNGWICKWEGPDFDATKNEISVESIEIAHEGFLMLPQTSESK
jgi:phage tail-like protein